MDNSQSQKFTPRITLNLKNYQTCSTLIKSELDNIGCLKITTGQAEEAMERKSYHLIIRYLSEEVLGYLSSILKTE